ncbi:MAG: aspartyl protease family protein [Candidatus Thorarchaeota archaeon]
MEIEFKLDKGSNHPHIPVFVNGKGPFTFTLDTGASATTISKSLADQLGIETYKGEKTEARGLGGAVPIKQATLEKLEIGSEVFRNEDVMVLDFEAALGDGCGSTSGVIGHTTLKHYVLSVNYPTNKMTLEISKTLDDETNWTSFDYVDSTHLVGVPTLLNGQGPFPLVIDTGSGGTIITPQVAENLSLSRDDTKMQLRVVSIGQEENKENEGSEGCENGCQGVGGRVAGYPANLDSIRVGPTQQDDHGVAVIDLSSISPGDELIHNGIIGYPFLKEYELIIDYPNQRVAFV